MPIPVNGQIRVGIIGAGLIGQNHSMMLRYVADCTEQSVRVVSIADVSHLAAERLAASNGDAAAVASFSAAIASLREQSTPYHLAYGLLDHAEYLLRTGDAEAATAAVEEASDIAGRLRCQPLLDRAAALTPPDSPTLTPHDSSHVAS